MIGMTMIPRQRLAALMLLAATGAMLSACAGEASIEPVISSAPTQAAQDDIQLSPEAQAKDLAADYLNFYTHATDVAPRACEGVELRQRTGDDFDGRAFDIPDPVVIQPSDEFGDRFAGDFYVETRVILADGAPVIDVVVSADGSCIQHAYS